MNKIYRVTYYYNAQGMEGRADTQDYGLVSAASKNDAINRIAKQEHPENLEYQVVGDHYELVDTNKRDRDWLKSCLTATEEVQL